MQIKQTYKTAFIAFIFALSWLLSGILKEDTYINKSKLELETISSVTVLKS